MSPANQFTFTKAVKHQEKLRLALDGPAGAGKTWTALVIATYLAEQEGGRIAVIDSERSSAKKYANYFDFDHLAIGDFSPHTYIGAMKAAINGGYAVLVIDSLTHAWEGTLEFKDQVTARSRNKNSYDAWREVTPVHNELVDTMLRAPMHVIATLRTKTEHLIEEGANGKMKVSKIGTKPIQRDGMEFEFDVVGDIDIEHTMVVSKTRCHEIADAVIRRPGEDLAATLWTWLNDGEPAPPPEPEPDMASNELIHEIGERAKKLNESATTLLKRWRDHAGLVLKTGQLTVEDANRVLDKITELAADQDDPDPDGPGTGSAPDEPGLGTEGTARDPEHATGEGDGAEGSRPDDAPPPDPIETTEAAAPAAAHDPQDGQPADRGAGVPDQAPAPARTGPSRAQIDAIKISERVFGGEGRAADRRARAAEKRHQLVGSLTKGATTSTNDLDDKQLTTLVEAMVAVERGVLEFKQRGTGEWALVTVPRHRRPGANDRSAA